MGRISGIVDHPAVIFRKAPVNVADLNFDAGIVQIRLREGSGYSQIDNLFHLPLHAQIARPISLHRLEAQAGIGIIQASAKAQVDVRSQSIQRGIGGGQNQRGRHLFLVGIRVLTLLFAILGHHSNHIAAALGIAGNPDAAAVNIGQGVINIVNQLIEAEGRRRAGGFRGMTAREKVQHIHRKPSAYKLRRAQSYTLRCAVISWAVDDRRYGVVGRSVYRAVFQKAHNIAAGNGYLQIVELILSVVRQHDLCANHTE